MTAPTQRIELITRGERRRHGSIEEKQAILAESLEPEVRPAEVICRHGITSGQLYSWRHQPAQRFRQIFRRLQGQHFSLCCS
jgi:transposase